MEAAGIERRPALSTGGGEELQEILGGLAEAAYANPPPVDSAAPDEAAAAAPPKRPGAKL